MLEYEIKRLPDGQLLSFVKDKSNAVAVRKNNKEITLKLGRGGQLFGISVHSSYNIVNNASILARESPKKDCSFVQNERFIQQLFIHVKKFINIPI
ncbi:hypothetical protein [Niallia sp. FSL R7-0271]|uniref:hypothetical protein n=1 Tax=Niallia sp. FSL R7-0271 TaxID=2921678 RepID=UPI0030F940C8